MADLQLKIAPTGMRLHEWIALERGYFQAEGIEPIIRWDIVSGIMGSWQGKQYKERPQDMPFMGASEPIDVINHCAWAVCAMLALAWASSCPTRTGSLAGPSACARSPIRVPADLANVPIAVGMRAGSHFNVPYRLEPYLPLDQIQTVNVGGFGARLTALLDGQVEATSLLDPQISLADELGLRRVMANTFKTLWVVPETHDRAVLDRYFRVLERADADLDDDPASCLPFWRYSIPAEFKDRAWDFSRFDVGERFFHTPVTRAEFDQLVEQAARWGLDDHMQTKVFDDIALPA